MTFAGPTAATAKFFHLQTGVYKKDKVKKILFEGNESWHFKQTRQSLGADGSGLIVGTREGERTMNAGKARLIAGGLIIGLLGILLGIGSGAQKIKLRVTVDSAPIKATPGISAPNLATVPLDGVLEAESKQGEWYKVNIVKDGATVTGYIHEMLVTEITESEARQELSPAGRGKSQAEIIAEIELRMEEDKKLIRVTNEPDKALDDLRPLLAKAFEIEDRQKQKQIACDIYYWTGHGLREEERQLRRRERVQEHV